MPGSMIYISKIKNKFELSIYHHDISFKLIGSEIARLSRGIHYYYKCSTMQKQFYKLTIE